MAKNPFMKQLSETEYYDEIARDSLAKFVDDTIVKIYMAHGLQKRFAYALRKRHGDNGHFSVDWFNTVCGYPFKLHITRLESKVKLERELEMFFGTDNAFRRCTFIPSLRDAMDAYPDEPVAVITKYHRSRKDIVICPNTIFGTDCELFMSRVTEDGERYTMLTLLSFLKYVHSNYTYDLEKEL